MNPVLKAIQAALQLAAGFLPERFRAVVLLVSSLLGTLNIPPADPKVGKVAQLVADLIADLQAALELTDSDAQESARLLAENRFLRAWSQLTPGGAA